MFMRKSEKIWWISVSIAAIGIIVFWIAGFMDKLNISAWSLTVAGIFGVIAISAKAIQYNNYPELK